MDSLEQAAVAFDKINAGQKTASQTDSSTDPSLEMHDLFGDLGVTEVDENSPPQGGGDNMPLKGENRAKAQEDDDGLAGEDEGEDDDELDPDANDEGDEDEGEDDDEGDDKDQDDPFLARKYQVIVDGAEQEVTVGEALRGYIRQETFHQRLNEIRDTTAVLSEEAEKLYADRKKAIELIEELQGFYDKLIPAEPNWDDEYARDPAKARALQKQYETIKGIRNGLNIEKEKVANATKEEQEAQFTEYRRGENMKLLKAFPHWQDPDKGQELMTRDLQNMYESLISTGFTQEEIKTIYDSRMIKVAMKAAKYDRLMAKKLKAVPSKNNRPPNSGVGRGDSRNAPKGNRGARDLLRKTGSIDAAASVFTDIISPKSRRK